MTNNFTAHRTMTSHFTDRNPLSTPQLIFILIGTTLLMNACGFSKPDNLKTLSPQELQSIMQKQDILLVDVHTPEQKHIPGTDHYVPFYRVSKHADKFPHQKDEPIYLYCKSGPMGNWAARSLFDLGYTNIYNLEGGIEAWKEAGLAVDSK